MINLTTMTPRVLDDLIKNAIESLDIEALPFGILPDMRGAYLNLGMPFKSEFLYLSGIPMLKSYIEFPLSQSITVSTILKATTIREVPRMETMIFMQGTNEKTYGPVVHDDLQAAMTYHNLITIRLLETVAKVSSN